MVHGFIIKITKITISSCIIIPMVHGSVKFPKIYKDGFCFFMMVYILRKWKIIWGIILLIIATSFSGCIENETQSHHDPYTIYVDDDGKADYTSIQAAINASPEGYTVFVYDGVYYENIVIDKHVNLIGENPATTIIDGNKSDDVIHITSTGRVNISGFTIRNSGKEGYPNYSAGIELHSNYNNITNNIITENKCGIYSDHARYNNFSHNTFLSNGDYGMFLYTSSDYATIYSNVFKENSCGLRIKGSTHCTVSLNVFTGNQKGMYFCCGARENAAFHNTFENNSLWHGNDIVGNNHWDNGYPSGGNYWDDYTGADEDGDGIGDSPYNITTKGQDAYPLMEPKVIYP